MTGRSKEEWLRIRNEAAAWVVRLSEPHSESEAAAFEAWIGADVAHEIAFEQESRTWDRMSALGPAGAASKALSEPPPAARSARARSRGLSRRYVLGGGIAASVVLAVGGGALLSAPPAAYASARGGRVTVPLKDGGRVELNTQSRLTVGDRFGRLRLTLQEGEALFDLPAKVAARCTVLAGRCRLQTTGARFCLRQEPDVLRLVVLEGDVALGAPGLGARRLVGAGGVAEFGPGGFAMRAAQEGELERVLSWRAGAISLAGETLEQAAAEFNRYNALRIRVDASVAGLRVGGYFDADDPAAFARAVSESFGLRLRQEADEVVIAEAG